MTVWIKRGADGAKALAQYEAEQKARMESRGKAYRFWLKPGEEARITFVDGALSKEGTLDIATFREHQLFMNGSWANYFVCTQDTDGECPICETNDHASLVGALTVIDHREVASKDGTKKYKDQVRLFVAKRDTIKLLQSMAIKRGGLAGCTFDALRAGDKSPSVGTNFDFVEKKAVAVLKGQFMRADSEGNMATFFTPLDYEKEIVYRTPAQLRMLGFAPTKIGGEPALVETADEAMEQHL